MPLHSGASFSSGAPAIMASSCDPFSRLASVRSALADRTRVAMRSASLRSRLDLGSIFGARHQSSRTPPVERHGTPRNRPTRTGRQQQGRAPNQDKRRLGARPAAAAVAGREDEGATLYWLVLVNERMRLLGVESEDWLLMLLVMGLGLGAGVQADVAWGDGNGVQLCPWLLWYIRWPVPMTLPCPMAFRIMPGS